MTVTAFISSIYQYIGTLRDVMSIGSGGDGGN